MSECKECKGKGWVFVGFGEDHECETCFDKSPESENIVEQSQSDAWNEAGTKPDHPCLCETKNEYIGTQFQYWNGNFFGLTCDDQTSAITFMAVESEFQNPIQWREVQS